MMDSLYLAWRYVCFHRGKTSILVAALTLVIFIPASVEVLIEKTSQQLRQRAATSPLLLGSPGSQTDLVLSALYFEGDSPQPISMQRSEEVGDLGVGVPLHTQFRARGYPIVGTSLEYFSRRELALGKGRRFAMLGECILGASVAKELELGPGDKLTSSPESVFSLAGVYPLRMQVVGVFAPTGTPDDHAVFVDVKTSWVIEGLGHGHSDVTAQEEILEQEDNEVTANASVQTFTEITPENVDSFHFHGDPKTFPITAVLVFPDDEKSRTLLLGRYQAEDSPVMAVLPGEVMDRLLGTIFRVRNLLLAGSVVIGCSTLLLAVLVLLLSLRLRQGEIQTMRKIGASWPRIVGIVAWENVLVLLISIGLATGLTALASRFDEVFLRWFLF